MPADFALSAFLYAALGLVALGLVAGYLAGLLGVGGGIVIVPIMSPVLDFLNFQPDLAMHVTVATSSATIIATSFSSSRAHHKRGAVDFSLLKRWGPFLFWGALLGGLALSFIDSSKLKIIFGIMALFIAFNMAFPRKKELFKTPPKSIVGNGIVAMIIGGLSALMGVGGGALSVPVLTSCSYPIKKAVGTASVFGMIIAIPATAGFIWSGWNEPNLPPFSVGYVNLLAVAIIVPFTMFTAPFGAKMSHSMQPQNLKRIFALFLIATSANMLWRAFA